MSDNFWARKLGANTSPAPAPFRPSNELFPLYTTPAMAQGAVPPEQMAVPQGQNQVQEYSPSVRLKQAEICPGCGNNTYFRVTPNTMPVCGTCNYNPRFEQSGYGERSLRSEPGQVRSAQQVAGQGQTMQAAIATLNAGGGERVQ